MLSFIEIEEKPARQISETIRTNQVEEFELLQKNELRRQMYERIAQGNALSELEDKASRQWNK